MGRFRGTLLATLLGTRLDTLKWNQGALLVAASTVLFAIDFVIAKHLLRGLATLTVLTARMTIGTAMIFAYVIGVGRIGPITQLSGTQWGFVVVTSFLLLLFTTTTFSNSACLRLGRASDWNRFANHHDAAAIPGDQKCGCAQVFEAVVPQRKVDRGAADSQIK